MVTNFEVRLQLDSNELEGSIPSEMERLSNLIILSLGQNQISGTIPTVLANLGRLGRYLKRSGVVVVFWSFMASNGHPFSA